MTDSEDLRALAGTPLSAREEEAMLWYAELGDRSLVASRMGIELNTVKNLLARAFHRLEVTNAISAFNKLGWMMPPSFRYLGRLSDSPDAFGRWLMQEMASRGLSQRDLAALSGVDHSTISRVRGGHRLPFLETAIRIAHAFRPDATEASAGRAVSVLTTDLPRRVSVAS